MSNLFDPIQFGLRLKAVRDHRGLGVRAAGEAIGVEKSTVSRIERGFPPTVENYLRCQFWMSPMVLRKPPWLED